MSTLTQVGEVQICDKCGFSFGTDEAEKCLTCLAYICPCCHTCNCIFGLPVLQVAPKFSRK